MSDQLNRMMESVLQRNDLNLKTRNFLEDLRSRFLRFGSFTEGQTKFLKQTLRNYGIETIEEKTVAKVVSVRPPIVEFVRGSCGRCSDGLINCQAKKDGSWFVFKCNCPIGEKRLEKYPVWFRYLNHQYDICPPSEPTTVQFMEIVN